MLMMLRLFQLGTFSTTTTMLRLFQNGVTGDLLKDNDDAAGVSMVPDPPDAAEFRLLGVAVAFGELPCFLLYANCGPTSWSHILFLNSNNDNF
jgi:hypothetical protein